MDVYSCSASRYKKAYDAVHHQSATGSVRITQDVGKRGLSALCSHSIQARIHHRVYFDFHYHNCPYTYPPLFSFIHTKYNINHPAVQVIHRQKAGKLFVIKI